MLTRIFLCYFLICCCFSFQVVDGIIENNEQLTMIPTMKPTVIPAQRLLWNDHDGKCIPDICHGRNISQICGFHDGIPIDLFNKLSHIYDSSELRTCLHHKFIVLLGDSTHTDFAHEIISIAGGFIPRDAAIYRKDLAWHENRGGEIRKNHFEFYHSQLSASTRFAFNSSTLENIRTTIDIDKMKGHRNLTARIYTNDMQTSFIHSRFIGGGKEFINDNVGLPGLLADNLKEELYCTLGLPPSNCSIPHAIILQSGPHDRSHLEASLKALPDVFAIFNEAKKQGTKIIWKSSAVQRIVPIENAAAELVEKFGFYLINSTIIQPDVDLYINRPNTHHFGLTDLHCQEMAYESTITQYLLHELCKILSI
jgi:hypothetical protein